MNNNKLDEFVSKWGQKTATILIKEVGAYSGRIELVTMVNKMADELEAALIEYTTNKSK